MKEAEENTNIKKKKKKKGKCFKMIRRLSLALTKKSTINGDSDSVTHDSGHMLKIHRTFNGTDSNIDMTEDAVRKTLKRQDLIQNHMEKEQALDEVKSKVSTLDGILHQLNEDYVMSETFCFCFKEIEMQDMVIEAINTYERKLVFPESGNQDGQGDADAHMSPINRLAEDSKRLSIMRHEQLAREKHYSKMSIEELIKELVTQEDRLSKINMEYREMEMRIEKMSKDYQVAREQYFWRRYWILKDIIEEATMDCIPLR